MKKIANILCPILGGVVAAGGAATLTFAMLKYNKQLQTKTTYKVTLLADKGTFSGEGVTDPNKLNFVDVKKGTTLKTLLGTISITPTDQDYKYDGTWTTNGTDTINPNNYQVENNLIAYPKYAYHPIAPVLEDWKSATTIRAMDNSTLFFNKVGTPAFEGTETKLEYSTDSGVNWTTITGFTSLHLDKGTNLYLKGDNPNGLSLDASNYWNIELVGNCNVGGSIMGLIDNGKNTITEIPANYCFCNLFNGSVGLKTVEDSYFSSVTKLTEYCYNQLFYGCEGLTIAPKLPTEVLAPHCYSYMFYGCKGLITTPELPAIQLANNCYEYMFQYCSGLLTVANLPATTLADECYMDMFSDCISLINVPEKLPALTLTSKCYYEMFNGCSALVTAPKLPATKFVDGGNTRQSGAPNYYGCYTYMFGDCTSLTTAPNLEAETIAIGCYSYMFSGCEKLTSAPTISATKHWVGGNEVDGLPEGCYAGMFNGCKALTSAPNLPVTTIAKGCYMQMFNNCEALTSLPDNFLPATNLVEYCYYRMFNNCAELKISKGEPTSDTLKEKGKIFEYTTTVSNSVYQMFKGCKGTFPTATPMGTPAVDYTYYWYTEEE